MNIKILPCDRIYSQYIRLRDKKCTRCGSPVKINEKGLPVSHEASHFHGRGKWSVRLDDFNVTTHCTGCHMYLTANPSEHAKWKQEQIGEREYDLLMIRANTPGKKDPVMAKIIATQLLKGVQGG